MHGAGNKAAQTAFKGVPRDGTRRKPLRIPTIEDELEKNRGVMESGDLEADVLIFIFENIDSVPHLEALLLVWQSGGSEWAPDQLASRLYVSTNRATAILEDLSARGYLARIPGEPVKYQFATDWDAQRQIMPRLADAYRTNLVRITTMIHSKGSASVREFARAFEIKRDN